MALIEWNESYSVNIKEIDTQHQRLFAMINDLNDAMLEGKGKLMVGKIIEELLQYAATHFTTEETYFDRFGYQETASHKKEHADFAQKVAEFQDDYDKGKVGLSVSVMFFLGNWIRNHIKGSDQKYAPFLQSHGVE